MPHKYDTPTGSVLNWASDVDQNTLDQASKAANLPFVPSHIALMPDAHVGMGATVGSVIPTDGAIIPAAVGVDIGCLDADTEYLSPTGWVKISDYTGGKVMQWEDGVGTFVEPLSYIQREESEFYHIRTKYGLNQMLSADHRMLIWERHGRDRDLVRSVVSAQEFYERHQSLVQGNKALIETSFDYQTHTSWAFMTDAQIRVQVMVQADGTLIGERCVAKFRKPRKIDRAEKLLVDANIEYTTGTTGEDTWFRFTPPLHTKYYNGAGGWAWMCNRDQLVVLTEEALQWDGNAEENVFYTRSRECADFMQFAFSAVGYRSVMRADVRDDAVDYRVFAHEVSKITASGTPRTDIDIVPSVDGYSYCFTVPSSFLVLRRAGNVFVTGNCGMIAVELELTSQGLPDDLEPLHDAISQAVPAGVGQGHGEGNGNSARERRYHRFTLNSSIPMESKLAGTAFKQFGSLGSGNHFVEVCLDERDRVWVVLHSGSRGVGNKLAQMHINEAKGLMKSHFINLEDPDLAYLVEGTKEFDEYIRDMLWAQDYAMQNREMMLDFVLTEIAQFLSANGTHSLSGTDRINCHHNFTQREHHMGRNLWITRKGAIRAMTGDRGVIPGSMGTKSYIVSGLGSTASYYSCSHGAGRRMSRSKARRELDIDTLMTQMAGKTWDSDKAEKLIDEDPRSYKDIDQVMEDQKDLVTIDHTLTQILNYKGTN